MKKVTGLLKGLPRFVDIFSSWPEQMVLIMRVLPFTEKHDELVYRATSAVRSLLSKYQIMRSPNVT